MGDEAVELQPAGASASSENGASGGIMRRVKDMLCKAKDSAETNKGFMGLLTDHTITLKNLLLSAVVVGLELLLSSEVFDCPLNNHKAYGTVFIVCPFFIVFFTNLVILGALSKLSDRCCVCKYCRYGDCCGRALPNTIRACFGPFVWLIASFADTTLYVCSEVGQPIEKRNLTNETVIKALEQEFADAKSTSHMLAWLFFSILVIGTATVIFSKRCMLKDNELLELDPYVLEQREAFKALEVFRERTRHLCKQDDGKNKKEGSNASASGEGNPDTGGSGEGSNPDPDPDPAAITHENGAGDKDKDKDEEEEKETDPLLSKDEEITLYPDGAPEQFGQKRVEKLFENWSTKDTWHYLKAYEEFAGMYPRVASGKPWKPWVSDSVEKKNVLKKVTS